MALPRVLFAITVYNGRAFVPACLRSAASMAPKTVDVDVLVLDDASPEPGFSEDIAALCRELGIGYYCTPRNLGIPRNVNMALLRAMDANYDYVVIANSDVLFAERLPDTLRATLDADPMIGSATSWSNNVSMFSLLNEDPDRYLSSQSAVNWLGGVLADTFGYRAVDLPAGISFSIMMPVRVVREVGLMDPIFGRGYCEETDWSLRSDDMGYRIALSPGSFTYHQGGGTNVAAGLVSDGHTTVPEHEEIIDMRWPQFRDQVQSFVDKGELDEVQEIALRAILRAAALEHGYSVTTGPAAARPGEGPLVRLTSGEDDALLDASYQGFRLVTPVRGDLTEFLVELFGCQPSVVKVIEPQSHASQLAETFQALGARVDRTVCYPARV